MFTQFFGSYLLNKGLVSPEKLSSALEAQKNTRLKLGVLAINAGLMTAQQVDTVHAQQQHTDKRIGDLMVEMGFVTREQVEELFRTQPSGHLLLGQALVDAGAMTNAQFEEALQNYKAENGISDADFSGENDAQTIRIISGIYNLKGRKMEKYISGYLSLLFKNIIRFIGDDFTPLSPATLTGGIIEHCIQQRISGEISMMTIISASDTASVNFAERFSGEELSQNDDYTTACISEFLNLHNGLFAVNVSNEKGTEIQLKPQQTGLKADCSEFETICIVPVCFSFGTIRFIIGF